MTQPLLAHRLHAFVPKSWGASIQALKENWKTLFEPQGGPLPLAEATPARLRLAERAVTMARRLARDQFFARSARLLANHRCAVCPQQLDYRDVNILEVAHIRPVSARGPDDPRNVLVLCPTHHALFDEGLWSLSDDGQVISSRKLAPSLAKQLAERIPAEWKVDPACVRWHRRRMCQ
jgi:predicted restriction endonuclease